MENVIEWFGKILFYLFRKKEKEKYMCHEVNMKSRMDRQILKRKEYHRNIVVWNTRSGAFQDKARSRVLSHN